MTIFKHTNLKTDKNHLDQTHVWKSTPILNLTILRPVKTIEAFVRILAGLINGKRYEKKTGKFHNFIPFMVWHGNNVVILLFAGSLAPFYTTFSDFLQEKSPAFVYNANW